MQVTITSSADKAVISIKDNGIGISKKDLENVFELFFRATEVAKGIGLGLHLVRQVADQLDGKIDVSSEIGKGTTFTITLPNQVHPS